MLAKTELKEMIRECIKEVLCPIIPKHTLSEILSLMLLSNNCQAEINHKRNTLIRLFTILNLTLNDDFLALYNSQKLQLLYTYIKTLPIQGDTKRRYIRYLKEFIVTAYSIESSHYKLDLLNTLPNFEKTKYIDKHPHLPYTKRQLKKLFNTSNPFFTANPDLYWICLIALYTGSRQNAILTLQYNNIIRKEGIYCIQFISNHPNKHLKNNASERIIPIHKHLIDLGLLTYVNNKKISQNAKPTDFIFNHALTVTGKYNAKYITRKLFKHFYNIKIKKKPNDGYDFHSFRKNLSLLLQQHKIHESYINDIIGWSGKSTMLQYYSNHTLKQIKKQLDKVQYNI